MPSRSKLWSRLTRDYVAIGDTLVREGKLDKAAEMYARGGELRQAAETAIKAGNVERAIDYLDRAGSPRAAGELLAHQGMHRQAVPFLEQAGAFWSAAEAAERSQQTVRAAGLFERAGAFERAADCFERSGDLESVARVLAQESRRLADQGDSEELRRVVLRQARALAKTGRRSEAARLLEDAGEQRLAGELWLRAEEPAAAARSFLEAGLAQRALPLLDTQQIDLSLQARILSETSHHGQAAKLYSTLGDWRSAADELLSAGDAEAAARLLEEHGENGEAADIFAGQGLYLDAARTYAAAGSQRAAADALSRAGRHLEAAGVLLQVDERVLAARELIRAQDHESALKALEGVTTEDAEYEDASLLLAPLLLSRGRNSEILDRLDAITGLPATVNRDLERSYWRGRALEANGRLEAARDAYERVESKSAEHRDVAHRRAEISERLRQGAEASATELGPGKLEPGTVVNQRYRVEAEIGRGGMSRVYRVVDRELGERVALKILYPRPWDTSNAEERLINEVQVCRRISHANVVRVFDFGRFRGGLFITMELLEGLTLDLLLREHGLLPVARTKALLEEVLLGLAEAHRVRILHRDLKPGNIVVTPEGAKLMDFGIARLQDADTSLTQTGQVIGSPMYMSPEQIQGQDLDSRSDLYSFGILGFTLLTGQEPFRGRTPTEISVKHLRETVPSLGASERCQALDPGWQEMIDRLLRKKREFRYGSADEVLAVLRSISV